MRPGPIPAKLSKSYNTKIHSGDKIQYLKSSVVKRSPPLEDQKNFVKGSLIQLEREIQKNEIFWKDFPQKVASLTQLKEKLLT